MITRSQSKLTPPSTPAASSSFSASTSTVPRTTGIYQRFARRFAVCSLAELYGFKSEEFPTVFQDHVMERSKIESYVGKTWVTFFTERIEATLPKHERNHVSSMSEAHLLATQRCAIYLVDSQTPSFTPTTSEGARKTHWKPVLRCEELLGPMESHQAALSRAQLYSVDGFFLDRCWKRFEEMTGGDQEMSDARRTLMESLTHDEDDTTESDGR